MSLHEFQQLVELALSQHGVVSAQQAQHLGIDHRALSRAVKSRKLAKVHRGVYRMGGAQMTWLGDLMAAHLWLGDDSAVSHLSAAALWELPGFREGPVELSTPRNRKPLPPVVVHKASGELGAHTTTVACIPVTNAGRTLIDIAGLVPADQLECAVEDGIRRRLTSLGHLRYLMQGLHGKGAHGVASIRRLLDGQGSITESQFETKLLQAIRKAGLPEPVLQHEVMADGHLVARVDFAYPWAKVAIEADSYSFHSGRHAWEADLDRRSALTSLGWLVIHVTYRQMQSGMDAVAGRIKRVLTPSLSV
ncbi:MAG: hypothetical protein QOG04_1010 [Actinomycetota bacterium]|jgi:very-short-patch-repair endonuclease|nr:hypothetical protein [Actinomycetota bacterium]